MNHRPSGRTWLAAAALAAFALPSHAMLVLQGPEDFSGTGLGAENTVLTLQSPGSSTFEQGSVTRTPGGSADVVTGDAMTGASQTMTRTLGSLGIDSATDLRVVFNALEPGNTANSITLQDLTLTIYSPTGETLFTSGSIAGPIDFADTLTGAGNSGFVFALDAAQAAGFAGSFADNLVGLSASLSNATGGFETFFVAASNGDTVPPVPEPQTYALMLAGLGALGFVARRRRRQQD